MAKNNEERFATMFMDLLKSCTDTKKDLKSVLNEVMIALHRFLGFRQITIALRDNSTNLYRYGYFMGFTQTAIAEYKKIEYCYEDLFDIKNYPRIKISDSVHIFPSEFTAYKPGEEGTFNHPSKLGKPRNELEDLLEDDYFNVFMYDHDKKCIGWLEISGTPDGKLPTRESVRWLELIASMLGKTLGNRIP